ncbi:DUF4229 domain-containing protein [Bounagaea algeriensis]
MREQESAEQSDPAAQSASDARQTSEQEWPAGRLAGDIALYTLARLGMLALVAAVLVLVGVPFLVAAAVSVIVVMPASMLVFGALRRRVATGIAVRKQARQARREALRAELRGEQERAELRGEQDDPASA